MTRNANEFLVLGATGKTGRRVVRRLRDEGRTVRAASRSGEVRFDWAEPATWKDALDGALRVYLVAPDDPAPIGDFVAAAVGAGVERFVVLSGRDVSEFDGGFGAGMVAAEKAVRDSGVEWTIIGANNFNQNFDEDLWREPLRSGRLALPIGDMGEPFVDLEDLADVAVALLAKDGHAGQNYALSGPRGLTFGEAVEVISKAAGRPMRYVELTPAEYRTELGAEGYPDEAVDSLDALFAILRAGHLAEPTDTVEKVLGRPPIDFETYAARAAASGAWS
ncbi:NAD(P)H-binding protein [Spirillospora sp. CA-294931]|uniref:NmrA family NAD(P)-binding protein n=1 Tax=Spirillospora sp. CA-294931 TaxID=3240042 RepID=UPI003D918239